MCKRDAQAAFRNHIGLAPATKEMHRVMYEHDNATWQSEHVGAPFGAVASVYALHKLGSLIDAVLRRMLKLISSRDVDDWTGVSSDAVR